MAALCAVSARPVVAFAGAKSQKQSGFCTGARVTARSKPLVRARLPKSTLKAGRVGLVVRASDVDDELAAVSAAVEALRLENERLKNDLAAPPVYVPPPPTAPAAPRAPPQPVSVPGPPPPAPAPAAPAGQPAAPPPPAAAPARASTGVNIAPPGGFPKAGGSAVSADGSSAGPKRISKDFVPTTPNRTNTRPIFGSEIKPIDEPADRFANFQYPPITTDGMGICMFDGTLNQHRPHLQYRWEKYCGLRNAIDANEGGLEKFSRGYEVMGFTRDATGITYREWAPAAKSACLFGDFNGWSTGATGVWMTKNDFGVFEVFMPNNPDGSMAIPHGTRVKIHLELEGQDPVDKIPAWIKMAVQAPDEIPFNGIYYDPPPEEIYQFKYARPKSPDEVRVYEAHVGMSSIEPKINSYVEFADEVIPRIASLGYNTVQLMAIQEHAYYASFGYHVTNFFAVSSRCGTPDELKYLIDTAHSYGLTVLMDIVHSHASSNSLDGINLFDGTNGQYFHDGPQGYHWMWDSRCFNYGNYEVVRFLLSNLRYWMEEFKFDGFRFDGVTSMMYSHHGLQMTFTGDYGEYFGMATDVDAMVYLMLANDMLHTLYEGHAITIAEDVSGMPALARPVSEGGVGFDYRLQMAIADKWVEVLSEWGDDYNWNMFDLVHCLENRRWGEKCISYAESHDQALVGDKTTAFWLMDKEMYDHMSTLTPDHPVVTRGIAIHKMIRQLTCCLGGEGYLNFMGNEFGHPEWIDFPRGDRTDISTGKFIPGNGNSYLLCRRRFDLVDMDHLRYKYMNAFDASMHDIASRFKYLCSDHQYTSLKSDEDKMIVVERGDCVFVFNFHPVNSYTDYRIGLKHGGNWRLVLSSDNPEFGGYSNLWTCNCPPIGSQEDQFNGRPASMMVYAPSRSVSVYAPVEAVKSQLGWT